MHYETELKIAIDGKLADQVRLKLRSCGFLIENENVFKQDRYFKGAQGPACRIRKENGGETCTIKIRETDSEGIEHNSESEFFTTNVEGLEFFVSSYVSEEPFFSKTKRGSSWLHENIRVEVIYLEELSQWFFEIEHLSTDSEQMLRAPEELRKVLEQVGLSSLPIEKRNYMTLLGVKEPTF